MATPVYLYTIQLQECNNHQMCDSVLKLEAETMQNKTKLYSP